MSAVRASSVEDPLQDAGKDEGAAEREPDLHLRTVQRADLPRRVGLGRRQRRPGRRGLQLRGLLGLAARLRRLDLGLLGLLASLALLARDLLLLALGLLGLLLEAACVSLRGLGVDLRYAGLLARQLSLTGRLGGRRLLLCACGGRRRG